MKFKEFAKTGRAKVLSVVCLGLVGVSSAFADGITFDGNKFTGTIDTVPFTSMAAIVIGLMAVVFAVRAGLRLLR